MITDQTTYQQALILIATISAGTLLLLFYFFMLKPKQNEKRKIKSKKNLVATEPEQGQYSEIIDHYPTYFRQDGVK